MSGNTFDTGAWFRRIGQEGPHEPVLTTLRAIIAAHTATIPFENIDVLLGRTPKLDLESLQRKMFAAGRGGYCFEQNTVLYAGLTALGFRVDRLLARVIRGLAADAARPATHMVLRVHLPEGAFLADVGYGNQTPTAPLAMRPGIEEETPHEVMRLWPVADELALQAKLGENWENIYRVSPHPKLTEDYEVANWFTATHPASPFVSNMVVAIPGPNRTRTTLFNGRVTVRRAGDLAERFTLDDSDFSAALETRFGLALPNADLTAALETLERKDTRGAAHPFFA